MAKLVPPRFIDRLGAVGGILGSLLALSEVVVGDFGSFAFWLFGASTVLSFTMSYLFQYPPDVLPPAGFQEAKERLQDVTKEIGALTDFMQDQLRSARDVERTLAELSAERARLAPLVQTDREVVQAVLEAHGVASRRTRWKEWLAAFVTGVVASAMAQLLVGLF